MGVDGRDLGTLSWDERADLRLRTVGYVFQDLNLLPGLTAVENVAFPLELAGVGPRPAADAAAARLDQLGVGHLGDRHPDDLSGGEQQRVAIARALVGDRKVILADEPTGALDSVHGEQVMALLRSACEQGVAGIVVTHDAQLAAWAHRVSLAGPDPMLCECPNGQIPGHRRNPLLQPGPPKPKAAPRGGL